MSALVSSWAMHAAQLLWQATIAGTVLLLITRLARNTSPRFRHALMTIALAKFMLPPMLPLPGGVFSAAPPAPELSFLRVVANGRPDLLGGLMLIHVAGVSIAVIRLLAASRRLRKIERRAEPGNGFLLTTEVSVPMTTGSSILIPRALHATLTSAELRHVLEHEREHIRRRDVRTGRLHSLVVALWWFHPLVHLLAREARILREESCDDALVARDARRDEYARTLLRAASFAAAPPLHPAAAIAESSHTLVRRLRRLASPRFRPATRLSLAAILTISLLALLLLPGVRVSHENRFAFDHATLHALHH